LGWLLKCNPTLYEFVIKTVFLSHLRVKRLNQDFIVGCGGFLRVAPKVQSYCGGFLLVAPKEQSYIVRLCYKKSPSLSF